MASKMKTPNSDHESRMEKGTKSTSFPLHQDVSHSSDEHEITIDMLSFLEERHDDESIASEEGDEKEDELDNEQMQPPCNFTGTLKYVGSAALLFFSITMVGAAIFTKQTTATGEYGLHPVVAFIVFWVLLLWLAQMEGGLNIMVGLKPIEKGLYAQSHPKTLGCTQLAHRGDNLERFIVGRQYLDLSIVFITNFMVSTIADTQVLGLPESINNIFLKQGLAVTLITIVIGQLTAQINSAYCMLDFVNNYVMLGSTYLAMTVEASGILHAVYLIQISATKLAGGQIVSNEPEKTPLRKILFWGRVSFSTGLLIFAITITMKALFDHDTTNWESVPPAASLVILVGMVVVAGIMESLQIAMFAVAHLPTTDVERHPAAFKNLKLLSGNFQLQSFLVGRQICQTIIMFAVARITTISPKGEENIWGVSDSLQAFFNTGVLAALISTILASLTWRVLAASFPMFFLGCPLARPIIYLCLWVERTGICYFSWSLAAGYRWIAGLREDKCYIGTSAERAKAVADLNMTVVGDTSNACSSSEEGDPISDTV